MCVPFYFAYKMNTKIFDKIFDNITNIKIITMLVVYMKN